MSKFKVIEGDSAHISPLIDLAISVERLFGPMIGHGFENVLEANVQRRAILVAVDSVPYGNLLGGIIFDVKDAPNYRVSWLAVDERCRGMGIGRELLLSALQRVIPPAKVEVTTFGSDNVEGEPARRLYESVGFAPGTMAERGPEGGTRQIFELQIDA